MTPRTYRNLPVTVVAGLAGGAFVVLFGLLVVADGGRSPRGGSATELYAISLAVAAVLLRVARTRLRVDEGGVTAHGVVRTRRLAWTDVVGAVADDRGLVVLAADDRPLAVPSLARSRWAGRLGRPGEDAAAAINAELDTRAA